MNRNMWIGVAACAGLALGAMGLAGCDSSSGYPIAITPSSATLGGDANRDQSVVFTAALAEGGDTNNVIRYPLVWNVADPSLGAISGSGGNSAVYQRTSRKGRNTITVRDQADGEGVATVQQN
jgi:hypothetical protein